MISQNIAMQLSAKSQEAICHFLKKTYESSQLKLTPVRTRMETVDREIYRTNLNTEVATQVTQLNEAGNKKKVSDIVMPILEPQIDTSLAFFSSVFLTGQPLFGVLADPQNMQAAKVIESILDEEARYGAWRTQLAMAIRDGLSHNIYGLECDWEEHKTYSPVNDTRSTSVTVKPTSWAGNCLRRLDMYNTFYDPRVEASKAHTHGEFAGYVELMTRPMVKQMIDSLPQNMNVTKAYNAKCDFKDWYHIPVVNPDKNYTGNIGQPVSWAAWAGLTETNFDWSTLYTVVREYVRIIPRDFGINVPSNNQVQIWKFIKVNGVLVYAEKKTNAHNNLPIVIGQMHDTGLGPQDKSFAEKLIPIQDLASAMWNARLAVQRRKVGDRALYDPTRINTKDVNSENPAAKIPVRTGLYNGKLEDAYRPIPFEDRDSGTYVQDANEMAKLANSISGQNPAQQGQFVKGNRTLEEYDDVQNKSSGRQRTQAILFHERTIMPLQQIMLNNILQYEKVGQVFDPRTNQAYDINPTDLRKAVYYFKTTDGMSPVDKMIDMPTMKESFQLIAQVPPLQQKYDLGKLFTYMMSLRNVNLAPFEYNPQQQLAAKQQQIAEAAAESRAETLAEGGVENPQENAAERR